MVVKLEKIVFFLTRGGIPYYDFDYFCKSFRGNGMDLYRRDAARHVYTQNGNNTINL